VEEAEAEGGEQIRAMAVDGVVKCQPWEVTDVEPILLPPIPPNLPSLKEGGKAGVEAKLVKVAAGWEFLIGLTDGGHVLGMDISNLNVSGDRADWVYMPMFCDINALKESRVFEARRLPDPQALEITHISAHFHTFATYSVNDHSHVLMRTQRSDTVPTPFDQMRPVVIPALQNRSIISVHIGDYHNGALTLDGNLYTWGQYSKGALGLGDPRKIPIGEPGGYEDQALANQIRAQHIDSPPDVSEPTLVKFVGDGGRRKFCFGAATAGWHFGALVIDVEGHTPEGLKEEEPDTPNTRYLVSQTRERATRRGRSIQPVPPPAAGQQGQQQLPPLGPFRVGFAGRGAFRGRGG